VNDLRPRAALFRYPEPLARWVARREMTLQEAHRRLHHWCVRLAPVRHLTERYEFLKFVLAERIKQEEVRCELVAHRIRQAVRPLLAGSTPSNALLALAHGVNGENGLTLPEAEVTAIVRDMVYWSLPPASPGRRRHAR